MVSLCSSSHSAHSYTPPLSCYSSLRFYLPLTVSSQFKHRSLVKSIDLPSQFTKPLGATIFHSSQYAHSYTILMTFTHDSLTSWIHSSDFHTFLISHYVLDVTFISFQFIFSPFHRLILYLLISRFWFASTRIAHTCSLLTPPAHSHSLSLSQFQNLPSSISGYSNLCLYGFLFSGSLIDSFLSSYSLILNQSILHPQTIVVHLHINSQHVNNSTLLQPSILSNIKNIRNSNRVW
jgi:hypothetical protein